MVAAMASVRNDSLAVRGPLHRPAADPLRAAQRQIASSAYVKILDPKPPPTSGAITRSLFSGAMPTKADKHQPRDVRVLGGVLEREVALRRGRRGRPPPAARWRMVSSRLLTISSLVMCLASQCRLVSSSSPRPQRRSGCAAASGIPQRTVRLEIVHHGPRLQRLRRIDDRRQVLVLDDHLFGARPRPGCGSRRRPRRRCRRR